MHPVDRLMAMEPAWSELVTAIVGTVAVLFVRRLLPPEQRGRGKTPLAALLLALVLMAFATVAAAFAAGTAARILGFLEAVLLAFGLTGLAGMLVFDVGFGRARVRVPTILRDLIQAVAFFIVLMGILREFGVNILSLVTTSAVLTAVIGLALQSTIANLFAGLALQVDRTVAIGDWVQSGARVGRVGQIKWRTTSIVTKDGDTVVVPNAVLLRDEVVNYSQPTRTHRMWVRVGFHYRHPPNDVKRILLEAVRDAPGVLAEPSPDVVPLEFGDSAMVYGLRYWIEDFHRDDAIDGEVRTRLWYAARRAGLEIPFPIRSVLMTEVSSEAAAVERERAVADLAAELAHVELLAPLAADERERLAQAMTKVKFAAGEQILRQGEPGDSLYLVAKGAVGVRLAVDGVQSDVATLGPGDFFGEMSLVTGAPRTATCAAATDVICYVVGHDAFQRVLEARPKIAEDISTLLGSRQLTLDEKGEKLSAEARARREAETSSRLLLRIRDFFHLG